MAEHAADEQERPDKRGEVTDIPPAITGFRAKFAYDIASEMLLPENTETEYPGFVAETAEHIAKFAIVAKAALNAYTRTKPAEVWEVEEIASDADFLELLTRLQPLVGQELRAEILMDDRFLGLSFQADLERVETLPDSEAVIVRFSNGVSLDLALGEQAIQATEHGLELHSMSGLAVVLSADGEPLGKREA